MTQPTQTTPAATATSVPPLIQQHDVAALALEVAAAVAASKALKMQLDVIVKASLLAWTKAFGPSLRTVQSGTQYVQFMARLQTELAQVHVDPKPVLLEYAAKARTLGVTQGFREAATSPAALPTAPDFAAIVDATQAAANAKAKVDASARLAGSEAKGTFSTVTRAMTPARQAVNDLNRTARTMTNTALNQGIADVAEQVDGQLLWIAERDACVVCAALSGHVVDVGHEFDRGATFGEKPIAWVPDGGLTGPPRHPSCRCRVTPYLGTGSGSPISLPEALKREAERSILRGWKVDSESENVRIQAADRLLEKIGSPRNSRSPSGWTVPKSVKERAQRAVEKGSF